MLAAARCRPTPTKGAPGPRAVTASAARCSRTRVRERVPTGSAQPALGCLRRSARVASAGSCRELPGAAGLPMRRALLGGYLGSPQSRVRPESEPAVAGRKPP